ncbi:protein TONSOKU [Amborella trichopoda]|uniref:Protein TONSOKU n=1 Tax=Amborella trichopoda TaxID=13333 RepID=U5CS71_AMBTC|nr:protein TONSOKU [Amborella trichopoda]XP_011627124.1 protein TONSOKU [Amborella trichopoda]ERN16061.1 hypothetical protein AMTR_s00030p00126060 [Amborella trichopoda]|eukprot:XP_006854594.1 protein TONSOKU [Amborella trichopoda]
MPRDDTELRSAKNAFNEASKTGNHHEEARWANVIGDIYKRRGEYVEALKWLRKDYEVSVKHLPEKHLLPTCQSLGEVYLRLQDFEEALIYQKKHLEYAKDARDLIEQQRATTQLGRTYYEIFNTSESDHRALRNSKKYFKMAMELARELKGNSRNHKSSSFLKEFIDAHNNLGMLEMDLDNYEEARKILLEGLKICNDEEVPVNDDARSRLHNNLGNVYMELRIWNKAKEHIERDIFICNKISHLQGEAKGFINLGELHWRLLEYDEAMSCYQKALKIARSMEDEDALVEQINQNLKTVKEARGVLEELTKEEQKLKKLERGTIKVRGTPDERGYLLKQNVLLDLLIDKSSMIRAWPKHREFAKKKKKVASELGDKEKLGDAFLVIGEAYQNLRNFDKAHKWYKKSWNVYKSIDNLGGQGLAKVNIGIVLDSAGDWAGALNSYEDGYKFAVESNLISVQITALENMHYSHMLRFDNVEKARELQQTIENLKISQNEKIGGKHLEDDCCSESATGEQYFSDTESDAHGSLNIIEEPSTSMPVDPINTIGVRDDLPLASFIQSCKKSSWSQKSQVGCCREKSPICGDSMEGFSGDNQQLLGRKRIRLVLSDDEFDNDDERGHPREKMDIHPIHVGVTSDEAVAEQKKDVSTEPAQSNTISCKVGDIMISVPISSCLEGDTLSIACMKVDLACRYYLMLLEEKRSKGVLPVIRDLKHNGKPLKSTEFIEDLRDCFGGESWIEVVIGGWVQKHLIKFYIDCCVKCSEEPNMKLLRNLYNLEVSEDEVVVSDCELQDVSFLPLSKALLEHGTVSILNLSHNLLGNETLKKLHEVFSLSCQSYGGLTLDLHCNRFGPTALFQICECPVLFNRLEVLNLSGNRLTDACASYLSTILEKCKALYSLSIESCSITSRTIQNIADGLDNKSGLWQLSIGKNNPISGNAMRCLLDKLLSLKRFSGLNLVGIKFTKPMVDILCRFAKSSSSLSSLMLGCTSIGLDGALKLTEALSNGSQELVKLDLSFCGVTSHDFVQPVTNIVSITGLLQLNLSGNLLGQQGLGALASFLVSPHCCLRVLNLNNCNLGLAGILQIHQSLAVNNSMEELYLAENVTLTNDISLNDLPKENPSLNCSHRKFKLSLTSTKRKIALDNQLGLPEQVSDIKGLEVADSEGDENREDAYLSGFDDSCASSHPPSELEMVGMEATEELCSKEISGQFIQDLSTAIAMAKTLQLLDLSGNGFSMEAVEAMHLSWSLNSRCGGLRHVQEGIVHFYVEGRKCCGVRPCCRRD